MKKKPQSKDEILQEIERDFARWDQIMKEGCADPSWPDGVNLNLKRNHIIYGYRKLLDATTAQIQLSLFEAGFDLQGLRPVPPEVPQNFMVKDGKYIESRAPRLRSFGYELVYEI